MIRTIGLLAVIIGTAFIYIPLGWAVLTWCWRTVGSFWGLW